MALNSTTTSSDLMDQTDSSTLMSPLERKIKFYTLLILQIPSVLCTIYIFLYFKWRHIQIQIYGFLLLVNGLIVSVELSFTLYFLHYGTVFSESKCSGWITLNYSLFQLSIYLMAWTSIERYLFIYHEQLIKRHIFVLHYLPILILTLYCPSLYISIVLFYTCQPMYDVRLYICGGPCYSYERVLSLLDWVGNGISMEMLTLFVNIILIIRHLIQQHQMKRMIVSVDGRHRWNRSVKLIAQLLAIALVYIIAWIPYSTIVLIQMFENSERLAYILSTGFAYIPYLQSLLLPFICILFIPEIKQKFIALPIFVCCDQQQTGLNRIHTVEHRHKTITQGRTHDVD